MPVDIPDRLTILIDTREKLPMLFPATLRVEKPGEPGKLKLIQIVQERVALDSGDYRIKEAFDACAVERKAGQRELLKNLLDDKDLARVARSLTRLYRSTTHRILLLEASPHELLSSYTTNLSTELLVNRLARITGYYGLHLLFTGRVSTNDGRRSLGTFLLHYMVGLIYSEQIKPQGCGGLGSSDEPAPA